MDPKSWDLNKLQNWLSQSLTQEDSNYEFKEKIPDDEEGKCRLKKEFCAFANARGGFLFFGIKNDKGLIGVNRNDNEFKAKISQITTTNISPPTIEWQLCNSIPLSDYSKCINIIEIFESIYWKKPHVFYKEGKGLFIPLREPGYLRNITDGSEIRRTFLIENEYYPEYNVHIPDILSKIKTSSDPEFTLLEAKLIQGYKSYLRERSNINKDDIKIAEAIKSLERIEAGVANIKKRFLTGIIEGGILGELSDRSELQEDIAEFLDKYSKL